MSQMESISEWDAHRATIERLYLQEGRTLKNTMNIMDTTYGFHKKKGQYEYKFREWGLKKYPMGAAEWKYIKRQMETRKRESGKDSEVYINGVLQSPKKVRYEIGRQGFESTIAKFQEDPFPKAPFGVEIRTPIPFTSNTQFHHSFPWFEYSRRLPISTNWDVSASTENALNQSRLIKIMVFMIDSLLTKCPNDFEVHVRSIPRTSSVLNVLMPEEYDGQNTSIAANLMNTSRANFPECIRLLMFLLSNNIHLELYDPSAITIRPAKQAHMHIMEMLLVAGFLSEHNMRSLLRQRPTEGATVERIFDIALSCVNIPVLRILMRAGISPNRPVSIPRINESGDESSPQLVLPLEFAAQVQNENDCIDLSLLLLSFGANINSHKQLEHSPLSIAVRTRRHRVADFLLMRGARASALDLIHTVTCQDIRLLQLLLDTAGLDVDTVFETPKSPKTTPLGYASSIGNRFMVPRLFLHGNLWYLAEPNWLI